MTPEDSLEKRLADENAELRARLEDAEETLRAIRSGDVDALVVESPAGPQIYTLQGLDAEAARFRGDILAQVSEAVIAIDGEHHVTYLNAAAEKQYGVVVSEALGRNINEIFENRWLAPGDETAAAAAVGKTGAWRGETLHVKRTGEVIHVESSISLLPAEHGRSVGSLMVIRDITDRSRAEEALRLSEQRFKAAVSTVSSLIWTNNAEGMMVGEQPGWGNFTGQTEAEYQGYGWAAAVHPDDAQPTIDAWQRAVANKSLFEFEHRVRRHDGEWRLCAIRAVPLLGPDGAVREWVGVHTDITERKQAEQTLKQNEALFSTIIDQAPGGVYVVDDEFRTLKVNALARPTFAAVEPVIGRNFREVMHILWGPEAGGQLADIFQHTLETGERYVSTRYSGHRTDLGAAKVYDWELQRLTLPNGRFGVVCYFSDITAQYELENALRNAKDVAEVAAKAKDDFLAALSHELRTPLTPVLMTAAALREDGRLPSDAREQLRMMERNIALEGRLIDDLLDLTRIAKGKLSLRQQQCDAHSLINLAIEIIRDDAKAKAIALERAFTAERTGILADPARFQQVIWNLLRNAVKFTPKGGRIVIRTKDCAGADGGSELSVEVQDSGIGIDAGVIDKIFLPFDQGHVAGDHRFGGLGLGLSIARAIVELHGGAIHAESEGLDRGATFFVSFPGATLPPHGTHDLNAMLPGLEAFALPPAPIPDSSGMRLLLVEDHEATIAVLARLLTHAGHRVHTARNITDALALAGRETFDGVISDLGLPDGTGAELMEQLRDRHGLRGVALSGYGTEDDLARSHEAGFITHLIKPVDFSQLVNALRELKKAKPAG